MGHLLGHRTLAGVSGLFSFVHTLDFNELRSANLAQIRTRMAAAAEKQ